MQVILSLVRRVTVFLLISSLISNLFTGTEYKKYMQYVSGLLVIVLVLVPVCSLFSQDFNWESIRLFVQGNSNSMN